MTADAGLIVVGSGNAVNADLPPSVDMTNAGGVCQSGRGNFRNSVVTAAQPMTCRRIIRRRRGVDGSKDYRSGSKILTSFAAHATGDVAQLEGKADAIQAVLSRRAPRMTLTPIQAPRGRHGATEGGERPLAGHRPDSPSARLFSRINVGKLQ